MRELDGRSFGTGRLLLYDTGGVTGGSLLKPGERGKCQFHSQRPYYQDRFVFEHVMGGRILTWKETGDEEMLERLLHEAREKR